MAHEIVAYPKEEGNSMKINHEVFIPSGLAEIACSRDYITTNEFGRVISKAVQTIPKEHSIRGEAFGIKPIKIGK